MSGRLSTVVKIALLGALVPLCALAFPVPPAPPRFLHDGANVLTAHDHRRIENRLMELDVRGLQIGVAILPSLDGETVEEATLRIAEAWKPGRKGRDDGVVIAAFMKERKMRIEVGYGLEERIPDSLALAIITDRMRPPFRAGRYGDGILDAVDAVSVAALGREAVPAPVQPLPRERSHISRMFQSLFRGIIQILCCSPFIFLFFLPLLLKRLGVKVTYSSGGIGRSNGWSSFNRSSGSSGRSSSFGGGRFGGGGASGSW